MSWFCPPISWGVNGCRKVALNVFKQKQHFQVGPEGWGNSQSAQGWIYAGRSKAEGENGLIDSTSGRVSNRFAYTKQIRTESLTFSIWFSPVVNKSVLNCRWFPFPFHLPALCILPGMQETFVFFNLESLPKLRNATWLRKHSNSQERLNCYPYEDN